MPITKVFKIDPVEPRVEHLKEVASILSRGGLVIIPTETVYGLAVDRGNKKAIERLYQTKERPKDKPFSIHIENINRVEELVVEIPISAYKLMDEFWPGPVTLIFKARGNQTIGIRMPDNRIAAQIIKFAGVDVVCPSSNISGRKPPFTFQEAIADFDGKVDCAVDGGPTRYQAESTIVDVTANPVRVVREGPIKAADIDRVVNKKQVLFVCTGNSCRSVMAKGYLEKKLKDAGRTDIEVISAGTMMWGGQPATEEVQDLLAQEGIDVSGHQSQGLTSQMLGKCDLILVMERFHEQRALQINPKVKNRLYLLREFAKVESNELDIHDPIGRSPEFYAETYAIIKEAIDKIIQIL